MIEYLRPWSWYVAETDPETWPFVSGPQVFLLFSAPLPPTPVIFCPRYIFCPSCDILAKPSSEPCTESHRDGDRGARSGFHAVLIPCSLSGEQETGGDYSSGFYIRDFLRLPCPPFSPFLIL